MALAHSRWDVTQDSLAGSWPVGEATIGTGYSIPGPAVRAGSRACRATKRAFDVVFAMVTLLVVLPVVLVLVLLIRRDSGPALFRHDRIGRDGRTIGVYKFRSMTPDAEAILAADPELQAAHSAHGYKLPAAEDPRITRLGRFLRATSLDELPQLLNVIRGDMSIVGPRPVVADEFSEYEIRGGGAAYLAVRPGMTGAWQVSGRSLLGYDERVALDASYVAHLGLLGDLRILARTVDVVAHRIGAH